MRTEQVDISYVVSKIQSYPEYFACQLNVELCISQVVGIEYLFEYVCNGHGSLAVGLVGESGNQQ